MVQVAQVQAQVQVLTLPLDEEEELPRVVGGPNDPLGRQAPGDQDFNISVFLELEAGLKTTQLDSCNLNYLAKPLGLLSSLSLVFFFSFGSSFLVASDFLFSPPLPAFILVLVKIELKQQHL